MKNAVKRDKKLKEEKINVFEQLYNIKPSRTYM